MSNVDGFTLVEGEATPLTFKGRPMLRVTALFEGKGGGQRLGLGWPPLDTVANLARTCRADPQGDADAQGRAANVRRTLTAGADFAVQPMRQNGAAAGAGDPGVGARRPIMGSRVHEGGGGAGVRSRSPRGGPRLGGLALKQVQSHGQNRRAQRGVT